MFPTAASENMDAGTEPFNPMIANGLAVTHMEEGEDYVDSIFELTAAGFPPGLKYEGCQRLDPIREYAETTKKRANRCVYDVAPSYVYLMEYKFSYNGQKIASRFMYLPFVSTAGTIYISGSRFVISPILADRVISVGMNNVFVRLNKARMTFNRLAHHYVAEIGGIPIRETIQVAFGDIYNKKPQKNAPKPTVRAQCTLVHYLLCKYGLTETFKRYGKCDPVVGGTEITEDTYPASDWVICRSTGMTPPRFGKKVAYEPSNLRLAIPRDKYTTMVKNLVAGVFYVVDHFPTMMLPEWVNSTRWMVLLGHLIWGGHQGWGRLLADAQDHFDSLDEYVDEMVRDQLRQKKPIERPDALMQYAQVENLYDFLALVIENFYDWLLDSEDRVSTMYDKELSILPFVYYQITSAINNLYFKLNAASKKELVAKKIESIMGQNLRPGLIYKITREHGEVTTTYTSGDNMALKITNLLVPQSNSTRAKKDRGALNDPAKRLHASIAEVGQAFSLPKSEPSGRSRVALTLQLDETGMVKRNENYRELLDSVQQKLLR